MQVLCARNGALALVAALAAIAFPAIAADGQAQWLNAVEVIVGGSAHSAFDIAEDGSGGAIVAWEDATGIYVQRLDASGARQWANGHQLSSTGVAPNIRAAAAGGAFVTWSETTGVYAQRVDASGSALWTAGGVKVANPGTGPTANLAPRVVGDGSGGAFICWDVQSGSTSTARLAYVSAAGTVPAPGVDGIALGVSGGAPTHRDIVSDASGGAIVVWVDAALDVVAQRVDAGTPWGATPTVVSNDSRVEGPLRAAEDGAGGVLVVWRAQLSDVQVRAQRLNNAGSAQWATNGLIVVDSDVVGGDPGHWQNFRHGTDIVSDGAGGAIVTWTDWRHAFPVTNPGDDDVYAQRISSGGSVLWTGFGVQMAPLITGGGLAPGSQRFPWIVADGQGGAIVVYQDNGAPSAWHVVATRLDLDGNAHFTTYIDWQAGPSYADQLAPQVVFDGGGPTPPGLVAVWDDRRNGPADLYAQKLELSSPANDTCSNALTVGPGLHEDSLAGATLSGSSNCGGAAADVWFRLEMPADGTLVATTCGTHDLPGVDAGVDTVLSLHSACPGSTANEIVCDDDWSSGDPHGCTGSDLGTIRDSAVWTHQTAGSDLWIRVSRYATSTNGSLPAAPVGDPRSAAERSLQQRLLHRSRAARRLEHRRDDRGQRELRAEQPAGCLVPLRAAGQRDDPRRHLRDARPVRPGHRRRYRDFDARRLPRHGGQRVPGRLQPRLARGQRADPLCPRRRGRAVGFGARDGCRAVSSGLDPRRARSGLARRGVPARALGRLSGRRRRARRRCRRRHPADARPVARSDRDELGRLVPAGRRLRGLPRRARQLRQPRPDRLHDVGSDELRLGARAWRRLLLDRTDQRLQRRFLRAELVARHGRGVSAGLARRLRSAGRGRLPVGRLPTARRGASRRAVS